MMAAAPVLPDKPLASTRDLSLAISRFSKWLEKNGYATYDPYDVLGTSYGRWARRLYYAKNPLGVVLSAPLVLMEIICPGLRAAFVRKDRYPTAEAQVALAYLNLRQAELRAGEYSPDLNEIRSTTSWLNKARKLADSLITQSIPGYRGHCWGYPFDWQNVNGLMPRSTPHITATPYCYEVFTGLYDATREQAYLDVARSIVNFVLDDLRDTPTANDAAASSYTPNDNGKVVNASAYRAYVLFDAAWRFQNETCYARAAKNLNFILQSQRSDGSWLYAIDNPAEAFIDHFHTCFVLKNLYKINRELQRDDIRQTIARGYSYYRRALFDAENNPKLYAIAPRMETVHLEMYNFAEAITVSALLADEIPSALDFAHLLAKRVIEQYQLAEGYFVTRVYRNGMKHTVPFLRWPQAQLFLALTNLLLVLNKPLAED